MQDSQRPRPVSSFRSLGFPIGLGALLALGAGGLISGPTSGSSADDGINRFQIRTVSQSNGAIGVVMVDSLKGDAWVLRLSPGLEAQPWVSLGKPK